MYCPNDSKSFSLNERVAAFRIMKRPRSICNRQANIDSVFSGKCHSKNDSTSVRLNIEQTIKRREL